MAASQPILELTEEVNPNPASCPAYVDTPLTLRQTSPVRAAILSFAFLPFLYYGTKDTIFHLRGRKVSRTEHILHLGIGVALVILFVQALLGRNLALLGALALFVIVGGIDEYIYHRGIPAEESDLHAKEHLALILFIAVSLGTTWLEAHHWRVSEIPAILKTETGSPQ